MDATMDTIIQNWPLRRVGLRVQDMARELEYYTHFGLSVVRDGRKEDGDGAVGLGVGGPHGREVLTLRALPGGRPRPPRTAGLYHFALLVPGDEELGSFLQYLLEQRIPLDGASDHLVSQALYLSDPEGNGIEVYADRPREQWPGPEPGFGRIRMATNPLNAPALLNMARPFSGFSDGLRLGHMHLNVGSLERSLEFYQQLGMELMVGLAHSANFASWDGYHHHLGMNVWAGRNAALEQPDMYGLDFFEIKRPELAPATMQDPDGVTVRILE
jgi:catechol 2,3-dioxygenase